MKAIQVLTLFISTLININAWANDQAVLEQTLDRAKDNIWEQIREDKYFNMPSFLGTPYTVQYMLYTMYAKKDYLFPKEWRQYLKEKIKNERRSDGSWRYLRDLNIDKGELAATIINYWALKVLGENINHPQMKETRQYIIKNGGLEKAPIFAQIFLAIFNNYPYSKLALPPIPKLIFSDSIFIPSALKTSQFGQWVEPHLLPIAYLTKFKVRKDLGELFSLDELYSGKIPSRKIKRRVKHKTLRRKTDTSIIKKMMKSQKKAGSYGGYTLATFLTNISYEHYLDVKENSPLKSKILKQIKKGDQFLTERHYDKDNNSYIFDGWTCDGRVWDTALLTQALIEAGADDVRIKNAVDYVLTFQTPEGGFPFGLDFESYPDHDDAAEVLLLLNLADKKYPGIYTKNINRLVDWLLKRQNKDGGWGAFDINNNGNWPLKFFGRKFLDSVDLFDESSADVTAHVIEALSSRGYNIENSEHVKKAYKYFQATKDHRGIWIGRWGINYIYGTSAVITAMSNAGIDSEDPLLKDAVKWLVSVQNLDGGFGESSLSYEDKSLAGIGKSTATQTAWALNALSKLNNLDAKSTLSMNMSAKYLVNFMNENGRWFDTSVVGTGHPNIVYMDYPSYAYAFPLIALSNYKHKLEFLNHELY